jgi:hypothetical protein
VFRTPPRASVEEAIPEEPTTYVEEVIPEEPIQVPLEHLLFTVPDNWKPPSDFREEASMPATEKQQARENAQEQEEFPTCFIEEEISEEMAFQIAVPVAGSTLDDSMEGERSEGADREANMEQHREATSSEAEEI